MNSSRHALLPILLLAGLTMAGCSSMTRNAIPDNYSGQGGPNSFSSNQIGSALGGSDVTFGVAKNKSGDGGGTGIGVNAYLWRGALDTLSFMPLASADPFGGVIITDWYQPPGSGGERFKATAYILGRELRSDAIRVVIFRQVQQGNQWVDAPMSQSTTSEIEDKVLARARTLRAQVAPSG